MFFWGINFSALFTLNALNRKIKDNEKLDAETRLAQKEEIERLQRLQEIQEHMLQQAAVDLRVHKQKDMILLSDTSAVPSDVSAASPAAVLPSSLLSSSLTTGVYCTDIFYCTISLLK